MCRASKYQGCTFFALRNFQLQSLFCGLSHAVSCGEGQRQLQYAHIEGLVGRVYALKLAECYAS